MVSASLLCCRLPSPPSPRRPGCGCPICCTPPTAAPTTCSRGRYDHLLPAGGLPTRRALVHPAARRRRTRRLVDQLGAGPLDRTARPRRLAGRADRGVRCAARNPLGRGGVATPPTRAGDQAAFPAGLGARRGVGARRRRLSGSGRPTLSVHAYSPPLTAMSYYEVTERNTLRRKRTELTDAPEG